MDDLLLDHSITGNFRYTAEPTLDRFRIAVGQYSDLDRIEEALAEDRREEGQMLLTQE